MRMTAVLCDGCRKDITQVPHWKMNNGQYIQGHVELEVCSADCAIDVLGAHIEERSHE